MKTYYQLNIFSEKEILTSKSKSYENFLKKFDVKKTTDDCYTPPAVYDVVKNFVNDNLLNLNGLEILRPFRPGGDYLTENYNEKTVVIDNPPFSIYAQIVKNYLRMGVKFFLFAPALTLFVKGSACQYVITSSNIIFENGARVRTSFATNLLPPESKILISATLANEIKNAQQQKAQKKKMQLFENYISSAQLLKYCKNEDFYLDGSADFLTHCNGRKIFGSAMRMTENDVKMLKFLKHED
jgi:hypothetical protein